MKRSWVPLGVGSGLLGIVALVLILWPPPAFRLKEIVILIPPTRISQQQLLKQSGVEKGENLLTIRLQEIRRKILKIPWMEEVALAKAYPGRLVVQIQEQEPVALLQKEALFLVNHEGVVFKKLEPRDPKNLPVITGLTPLSQLPSLVALIDEFQGSERLRPLGLSELHWDNKKGVALITIRPVMKVLLGRAPWSERLERLTKILPEIQGKSERPISIDLTYNKRIFVKREAQHAER